MKHLSIREIKEVEDAIRLAREWAFDDPTKTESAISKATLWRTYDAEYGFACGYLAALKSRAPKHPKPRKGKRKR